MRRAALPIGLAVALAACAGSPPLSDRAAYNSSWRLSDAGFARASGPSAVVRPETASDMPGAPITYVMAFECDRSNPDGPRIVYSERNLVRAPDDDFVTLRSTDIERTVPLDGGSRTDLRSAELSADDLVFTSFVRGGRLYAGSGWFGINPDQYAVRDVVRRCRGGTS